MRDNRYPAVVRSTAEAFAGVWLARHDLCDCATQRMVVTARLLPIVNMFYFELRRRDNLDIDLVTDKVGRWVEDQHAVLARGLHKPGASAALPDERRETNGTGQHC